MELYWELGFRRQDVRLPSLPFFCPFCPITHPFLSSVLLCRGMRDRPHIQRLSNVFLKVGCRVVLSRPERVRRQRQLGATANKQRGA